ncbi:MAG: DUF1592 domain-containing protein [Alphaproteobacteria bacterium]|nr:DUF1592 domain-containing protein [Alphaproteobacteria bacterium]
MRTVSPFVLPLWLGIACATPVEVPTDTFDAAPPVLRRLTQSQVEHAVRDLFGADVYVPADLDAALRVDGLEAIGTARIAVSPRGVERYEAAAFAVARQALDATHRAAIVPCSPAAADDAGCAAQVIRTVGRRVWRRPLTDAEVDGLVAVAVAAGRAYADADEGLVYGVAGLLQSPWFLMRPEPGADDPAVPGARVYDGYALASRLSFFLWDTIPDDALLDAAARGDLSTDDGVDAQVVRMVADPRAHDGLRAWAADLMQLSNLKDVRKDTTVYPTWTDDLAASAGEQVLRSFEDQVFTLDADLGGLLTSRRLAVDPGLARAYGVAAPVREGFGVVRLPDDSERVGLLGQLGFLALHAHAASSSATLRGRFVREALLCETIDPPPPGVNTTIPEPSPDAPTLRDRVAAHLDNPSCAGCHARMDPLGLALEQFDGAGAFRTEEGGATIDVRGTLDDVDFVGASGLADAVRAHPAFVPCLVEQVTRYALGRPLTDADRPALAALVTAFEAHGRRLQPLWMDLAQSPLFRRVGEVE